MFRHVPPAAPYLGGRDIAAGFKASFDGARTAEVFAEAVARYAGVRVAFLASSGRAALYLLLTGLARQAPGRREVVLPAYTCPSLVKVIQEAGLETRLCDISPQTLDLDREQLPRLLGDRTLAVIPVHPFGIPQPVQDIVALAEQMGVTVIEDAAQAMGARLDGRMAGAWGHFGLTSLGPGKALSTGGGGVLLVDDDERADLVARSWQGLPFRTGAASIRALLQIAALAAAFQPFGWWWASRLGMDRLGDRESTWGFRLQGLTTAQAGVGHSLLHRLDAVNAARRERAARLMEILGGARDLRFPEIAAGADAIYVRLPVLVAGDGRRDRLFDALQAQGIGVGKMYKQPLPVIFPELNREGGSFIGARTVAAQLLTLPTHRFVTARDVARIAVTVRQLDT